MQEQKSSSILDDLRSEAAGSRSCARHRAPSIECSDADFLNQMLYLDTKIFMTSLNLTYNDKMSMASSVEVRVPFLDRELAEFVAWNVPPDLKLKGFVRPTTKYIFRKAMQDILAARSVAATESRLRRSGRLLAGARSEGNGRRSAFCVADCASAACFGPKRCSVRRRTSPRTQDWSMQIWQFLTLGVVDADISRWRRAEIRV